METKTRVINSKGSFYSTVNQRDKQIAGLREKRGCIPRAGRRYQMKSVSHSSPHRLLLFPSRRNRKEGKEKDCQGHFSFSPSLSHTQSTHEYSQRADDRHHFCWWWESSLIVHCSGHGTNLWVATYTLIQAAWRYPWGHCRTWSHVSVKYTLDKNKQGNLLISWCSRCK